jgi:hypothetical protein
MYAKTIKRHLKNGGHLEDWLQGEPGRCSNGGRYYIVYRLTDDDRIISRTSYEEAEWDDDLTTLDELAAFAAKHWHDPCDFIDGPRFVLA